MNAKRKVLLLWVLVNALIILGVSLAGIRVGSWAIGGIESAGRLGGIAGYGLLIAACALIYHLIYRGRYP